MKQVQFGHFNEISLSFFVSLNGALLTRAVLSIICCVIYYWSFPSVLGIFFWLNFSHFYNFSKTTEPFIFLSNHLHSLQAIPSARHSVNYPNDDINILVGWTSSGWNSLVVSLVILQPHLNLLSVSRSISAQEHPAPHWVAITGNTAPLVSECVLLNCAPWEQPAWRMSCGEAERADWDPGGPVQTDRSFTAWTVHIPPGCYGLTSYNREICQALTENKEVEKMCVRVWRVLLAY